MLFAIKKDWIQMIEKEEEQEEEQNWYFTFGVDDKYYSKKYAKLWGTQSTAREKMVKFFGNKWAFQYKSLEEFNPDRWGLTQLNIQDAKKYRFSYGDGITFSQKLSKDLLWLMYETQVEQYKETKIKLEKEGIILMKPYWELYPSENGRLGMLQWRAYGDKK